MFINKEFNIESADAFARKLNEIITIAFSHFLDQDKAEQDDIPRGQKQEDILKTHREIIRGFKLAQNRLIEEIIPYQLTLSTIKVHLKEARTQRNKERTNELSALIQLINRRLVNLSHIADGIALKMANNQVHVFRRLHIGEKSGKNLKESNIRHSVTEAERINQKEDSFALISDLTNIIQIGDLFILEDTTLYIKELKEGKVNDNLLHVISQINDNKSFDSDKLKSEFTVKEQKQISRMLRQERRATQAVDVINNDEGTDPQTGVKIIVKTPTQEILYYDEILRAMYEELSPNKHYSYYVIDDCLHLGMYKENALIMASIGIRQLLKNETENSIVIDYGYITEKLSDTLFSKPYSKDLIVKLMVGYVKVMIGINLDKMIEVFNSNGLNASWMTRKETAKVTEEFKGMDIIVSNNMAIKICYEDGTIGYVSGGIIFKIVFENIYPSSLATTLLSSTGPSMED